MKILVAEDNRVSRLLLTRTLSDMGFNVVSAENGQEAWDVLRGENPPPLAILDWMMPLMDGIEVCRKVREMNRLFPTYILLLTARQEKEDIISAFQAGADDYIVKPFDRDELVARVRVGQRLVEKQVMLNSLIDSIPGAVFFKDMSGAYLGCNPAFAKIFGKSRSEIIGKRVEPDSQFFEHCSRLASEVMLTHEPVSFDEDVVLDENERLFNNIIAPIQGPDKSVDGILGICHDITDRSRMESEHRRLAKVIDQSTEAVILTDISGNIEYANASFERLTGYDYHDVCGENINILKSGKHEDHFYKNLWETILRGETWSGRFINLRKDKTQFESESLIFAVRDRKGEIVNFVGMMRDVTQECMLEEQLRQAQKMNAIGQLAGGVAHDFNNLLMVIRNSAQFIKMDAKEGTDTESDAVAIIEAANRAAMLTRQLLAFSRKQVLDTKKLDLNKVVEDLKSMLERLMPENIRIQFAGYNEPCVIHADVGQLEQVVMNMAINARDAMSDGGVISIEIDTERLTTDLSHSVVDIVKEDGDYAVIKIIDNGSGMSEETISRIFEPFFTTKGVGKGTGLGLSTAYGIIRQHNGNVAVSSVIGEGTTFKIYLPLKEGVAKSGKEKAAIKMSGGAETILVVEDEPGVLKVVQRMLKSLGYIVHTATNGVHALNVLKDLPKVDLLFSDVMMPEMNGTDLAERVRKDRPEIKILFASGYSEFHIKEGSLLDEKSNLIQKPYELSAVSRKVRDVLDS